MVDERVDILKKLAGITSEKSNAIKSQSYEKAADLRNEELDNLRLLKKCCDDDFYNRVIYKDKGVDSFEKRTEHILDIISEIRQAKIKNILEDHDGTDNIV